MRERRWRFKTWLNRRLAHPELISGSERLDGDAVETIRDTIALDVLARVGELDILVFHRRQSVVDVGDEQSGWSLRDEVPLPSMVTRAQFIYILSVARLVGSRPCPDRIASLGFGARQKFWFYLSC